jgi:hypothetical protein
MGADITFYKGEEKYYFRDSYNKTNLAWVIDLSYWKTKGKKNQIKFFEKLADISDQQIESYVEKLHSDPKKNNIEPDLNGWVRMFKEARDEIKSNLELIRNCDKISWSV